MKKRVFQDKVRLIAFLGCFVVGFSAFPAYSASETCDANLAQRIRDRAEANAVKKQDALHQAMTPPADLDAIANTPCISKELNKITGQFANIGGGLNLNLSGSASGIMNNFFKAGFESLNETASFMPQMLDFQTQASQALSGLLNQLGGATAGAGFDSELCGLMLDTILKFVQCQVPLELPDLGNLTASLNVNMPEGCAGNALRDTIYAASNNMRNESYSQPITRWTGSGNDNAGGNRVFGFGGGRVD